MKEKESIIVDHFENISVLFCDIVGFTPLSAKTPPEKLVNFLNQIFTAFDKLCAKYGVEKIKTIGDAYMAVSGVPNAKKDHAQVIAKLALDMLKTINNYNIGIKVRIGLHCGEAVAGVIGKQKFSYDLWGDTVNTASRMESNGAPDKIACSNEFYERLKTQFVFKERGMVDIKGKGRVQVWYLEGMKN